METEPKQSPPRTPGRRERGWGQRCNKCGHAFPNPHPSAKHRRAHKKKCDPFAEELKPEGEEEKKSSQEIENVGLGDQILERELKQEGEEEKKSLQEIENVGLVDKIPGLIHEDLTERNQIQNSLADLSHEDFHIVHVENIAGFYPSELDDHGGFLKRSVEYTADNASVHPVMQEVQNVDIGRQSSPAQQSGEEPDFFKNIELGLCHLDADKFTAKEYTASSLEEPSVHKTGPIVDSYNQTDSAGRQWNPLSDGSLASIRHGMDGLPIKAPLAINKQASKDQQASNFSTEDASARNYVQNIESCGTFSSFMNLVQPCKLPDSNEFELMQDQQQLDSSLQGRKDETDTEVADSEMTTNITNGRNGMSHTPLRRLRSLLLESDSETEDAENVHDNNVSLPSLNMGSDSSNETSNEDQEEWNTPSRHLVRKNEKQQAKGKSSWVTFMCCKYNECPP